MQRNLIKPAAVSLVAALMSSACTTGIAPTDDHGAKPKIVNTSAAGDKKSDGSVPPPEEVRSVCAGGGFTIPPHRYTDALKQRSIYFEQSGKSLGKKYRAMLLVHAKYLQDYPRIRVVLVGRADSRGSPAYNLMLGQWRADSVLAVLKRLGIPGARIEAISYGSEGLRTDVTGSRPSGIDRRVDIVYQDELPDYGVERRDWNGSSHLHEDEAAGDRNAPRYACG